MLQVKIHSLLDGGANAGQLPPGFHHAGAIRSGERDGFGAFPLQGFAQFLHRSTGFINGFKRPLDAPFPDFPGVELPAFARASRLWVYAPIFAAADFHKTTAVLRHVCVTPFSELSAIFCAILKSELPSWESWPTRIRT